MEKQPRIAILGAGSIGIFHAREFKDANCKIIAILGSSEESSRNKARELKEKYNLEVKSYHNIEQLLKEKLDAVSICTPPEVHSLHTKLFLEAGVNIFCEKPFVLNNLYKNYPIAKELYDLAKNKNKILTVNTQWPLIFEYFPKDFPLNDIKQFSMHMEGAIKGDKSLTEFIPHMNSMLIRLIPKAKATKIRFPMKEEEDKITIEFQYGNCQVSYSIGYKEQRPRNLMFSINNTQFTRKIGENYQQQFVYGEKTFAIEDPLRSSIREFVSALSTGNCLIPKEEVLKNVKLQDLIMYEYYKQR